MFTDVGSMLLPGVKRLGDWAQTPVLGAFTVCATPLGLTPPSRSYMSLVTDDGKPIQMVSPVEAVTWAIGVSYCSPQDIPRFQRVDGELLAYQRTLDPNPFLVGTVHNEEQNENNFPFRIFQDPEFVAKLPDLPSWVKKALKLQGYFKLAANKHHTAMVTTPLVRLLFGQQTPAKKILTEETPPVSDSFLTDIVNKLSGPPYLSGRVPAYTTQLS